jgi:hypothetical protein
MRVRRRSSDKGLHTVFGDDKLIGSQHPPVIKNRERHTSHVDEKPALQSTETRGWSSATMPPLRGVCRDSFAKVSFYGLPKVQ